VKAPTEILFRWLCQQVGSYSYDWIDRLGTFFRFKIQYQTLKSKQLLPGVENCLVKSYGRFKVVEFEQIGI